MSASRKNNLYFAPDGDGLAMAGGKLDPGEQVADPKFRNPAAGDFGQKTPGQFGAFPAQDSKWTAGILP